MKNLPQTVIECEMFEWYNLGHLYKIQRKKKLFIDTKN